MGQQPRWHVVAKYDDETLTTDVEEIGDVQDFVEDGPGFNLLQKVTITYNWRDLPGEPKTNL